MCFTNDMKVIIFLILLCPWLATHAKGIGPLHSLPQEFDTTLVRNTDRKIDTIRMTRLRFYDAANSSRHFDSTTLKLLRKKIEVKPELLHFPYPEIARRESVEGNVHLAFLIDTSGRAHSFENIYSDYDILRSSLEHFLSEGKYFALPRHKKNSKGREYARGEIIVEYRLKPPHLKTVITPKVKMYSK
jgi:hypothetical protein